MAIKIKTTTKKTGRKADAQQPPIVVDEQAVPAPSVAEEADNVPELPQLDDAAPVPERGVLETPVIRQGSAGTPIGSVFGPRIPPPSRAAGAPLAALLPRLGEVSVLVSLRGIVEQRLETAQTAVASDPDAQADLRASEVLMLKQVLQWLSLGEAKD